MDPSSAARIASAASAGEPPCRHGAGPRNLMFAVGKSIRLEGLVSSRNFSTYRLLLCIVARAYPLAPVGSDARASADGTPSGRPDVRVPLSQGIEAREPLALQCKRMENNGFVFHHHHVTPHRIPSKYPCPQI